MSEQCPCRSGNGYATCCEPFLLGTALPSTPAQLMRSRYTAFCKGNVDYLSATQHPSERQPDERSQLAATIRETTWLSLRLLATTEVAQGNRGTVEFAAFFRTHESVGQLHERSTFVWEAGRWFYLQGVQLPPIVIARNETCWCGSGRKLKQCHTKMP